MRRRALLWLGLVAVLAAGGMSVWWFAQPVLIVHVDHGMSSYLQTGEYRKAFWRAGVRRLRFLHEEPPESLGESDGVVRIALKLSPVRNPRLDEEMLARGLTGPGYTDGHTGIAYHPDIRLFIRKHRKAFQEAGILDWAEVERRLITNTAVHESWHAIAQSTSHNPVDKDSVMYQDPGKAPLGYGWRRLRFTAGHEQRLREIFRPRLPWR